MVYNSHHFKTITNYYFPYIFYTPIFFWNMCLNMGEPIFGWYHYKPPRRMVQEPKITKSFSQAFYFKCFHKYNFFFFHVYHLHALIYGLQSEAPNDSDYQKPQPQHPNPFISNPPRSQITKASQSQAFGILQFLHIGWTLYANSHGGMNIFSSNYIFFW